MSNTAASISSGWALVQQSTLRFYGLDPVAYYQQAGLCADSAADPNFRYPAVPFNSIWTRLAAELPTEAVGLTAANFVLPSTFNALGLAMWTSKSIHCALERLIRFSKVFHTGGSATLISQPGQIALQITRDADDNGNLLVTDEGVDCFFGALANFIRQLSGRHNALTAVTLQRARPADARRYLDFFHCDVKFDCSHDTLVLDPENAVLPLPTYNPQLTRINESEAESQLEKISPGILYQLQLYIENHLVDESLGIAKAATTLGTSQRSLQRELRNLNSSFRSEVEKTRKKLANQYLLHSSLSIGEIAYLLGYSNANNFSRAYRGWFNQTPEAARLHRPRADKSS